MSAKAYVEADFTVDGVKIALVLRRTETSTQVWIWPVTMMAVREIDRTTTPPDDAFLRLPDDVARALYEGLAAHYGGNLVDARRLREDYVAERARVDVFIRHVTAGWRLNVWPTT